MQHIGITALIAASAPIATYTEKSQHISYIMLLIIPLEIYIL